jgi:hypothetical protein
MDEPIDFDVITECSMVDLNYCQSGGQLFNNWTNQTRPTGAYITDRSSAILHEKFRQKNVNPNN